MHSSWRWIGVLFVPLAVLLGCDQTKQAAQSVQQAATQVQQTIDKAQAQAKEQLKLAGEGEVSLATPVKTSACYVLFTPPVDGAPGVLALQSYRQADEESIPAIYLQTSTDVKSLSELSGETLAAQMFVKPDAERTWFTAPDEPVQLRIVSASDSEVTAEVVGGTLRSTSDGATHSAAGRFTAVVP